MSRVLIWGLTEELVARENELDWSYVSGIVRTNNSREQMEYHGINLKTRDQIQSTDADYLLIMDEEDKEYNSFFDLDHLISREYLGRLSYVLPDACFPPIYNYVNSNIYAMGARSVLDVNNVTVVYGNKTPHINWPKYQLFCNQSDSLFPFYRKNLYNGLSTSNDAECALFLDPFYYYDAEKFLKLLKKEYSDYRYVAFNLPLDYKYPAYMKKWHDLPIHELGRVYVVDNPMCGLFCMWEPEHTSSIDIHMHVITHKECDIPKLDTCYNKLYVGKMCATLTDEVNHEGRGNNISLYNQYINENTGIYWVWKNDQCDYVGFDHYRRFFTSDDYTLTERHILLQPEIENYLNIYDLIVSEAHIDQALTVEQRFATTIDREAYQEGMQIVRAVIREVQPDYVDAFEHVFGGHSFFPCNMFIMPWKIFDQYCQWLFSILPKACEQFQIEKYDNYSCRAIGFIAERMLTVWLMNQTYRVKELPIQQIDI